MLKAVRIVLYNSDSGIYRQKTREMFEAWHISRSPYFGRNDLRSDRVIVRRPCESALKNHPSVWGDRCSTTQHNTVTRAPSVHTERDPGTHASAMCIHCKKMTDDDFPSRWLSIRGARERVEYELQKIADDDFLTRWPHIRDNKKEPRSGLLYERSRFPPKYPSRYAHMYARMHALEITDGNHPPRFRWEWRKSNRLLAEIRGNMIVGKEMRCNFTMLPVVNKV